MSMSSRSINGGRKAAPARWMRRLNAVLVYEDFLTGLQARRALERVVNQLQLSAAFDVKLWRMDLLQEPALLELTVSQAAEADIVLLALKGWGERLGTLSLWFNQWLECRGSGPCALAVLVDTSEASNAARIKELEVWRAAALAAGVDVFLQDAGLSARQPTAITERSYRASAGGRPLPGSTGLPPYRDWGINE